MSKSKKELRAENDRIWAEVVRWKTTAEEAQAARREDAMQELTWQTEAEENHRRAEAAEAERDALRAQVAAVRALLDTFEGQDWPYVRVERVADALSSSEPVSET